MTDRLRVPGRPRDRLTALLAGMFLLFPVRVVQAQNSFPLADLVPLARGGALGGQALAGDLLAAGIDPTVADGSSPGAEAAGGSSVLELSWAAAGIRLKMLGTTLAVTAAALSYGDQYRTDLDDRLGVFGGSFSPTDISLAAAVIILAEPGTRIGAGATLSLGKIDAATAAGLSLAVAARQRVGPGEVRAALSGAGTALSPYGASGGTRLPARLRVGGAMRPGGGAVEFSAEGLYRFGDRRAGWHAGVEWCPLPEIALRTGLGGGDAVSVLSDGSLSRLGITVGAAWQRGDWRLSYLYRPGGLLGTGHLVALGWRLGALR